MLVYSLTTPFSLVDDYHDWGVTRIFDSPDVFIRWIDLQFRWDMRLDPNRYRPLWHFNTAVIWNVFGPTPWPHHLLRWVIHFGAAAMFAAAFLSVSKAERPAASKLSVILSLSVLGYLLLFFPNQPAAPLGATEKYTVFFLGLCTWMAALTLARHDRESTARATRLTYGLFFLGYLGLAVSKETNLAVMLWLLAAYFAYVVIIAPHFRRRRLQVSGSARRNQPTASIRPPLSNYVELPRTLALLGGLPLVLVFAYTLAKVYGVWSFQSYGMSPITPNLVRDNAGWILRELFQLDTSLVITLGLAALSVALLLALAANAAARRFDPAFVFVIFLLGLFVSMFLIFCTSWSQALRYWYPLVPVFAILLAWATSFVFQFAAHLRRRLSVRSGRASILAHPIFNPERAAAVLLGVFVVFFTVSNYFNFLMQTVVQHRARHADADVLTEITQLHDQGQYVQLWREKPPPPLPPRRLSKKLADYFHEFLPYFYGGTYDIHTSAPTEPGRLHYVVRATPADASQYSHALPNDYWPLAFAQRAAALFQAGRPYWRINDITGIPIWHVYASDGRTLWSNGQEFRRLIESAGAPVVRGVFDVYTADGLLVYRKESCTTADTEAAFFLHVTPLDPADLPRERRPHGFDNLDFRFDQRGVRLGGACVATVPLPAYPAASLRTGQYVPGEGSVWEGEAAVRTAAP